MWVIRITPKLADSLQAALDSVPNYIAISSLGNVTHLGCSQLVVSLGLFPIAKILISFSHIQIEGWIKTIDSRVVYGIRPVQRLFIPMQNFFRRLLVSRNIVSCDASVIVTLALFPRLGEQQARIVGSAFHFRFHTFRA